MKVAVVVNAGAGSIGTDHCEERVRQIRAAFDAVGVATEFSLCEPARLTATARLLARTEIDAVVAAGGDGTVSAVATGLVETGTPLAVLPLGTLNHFAKDLGMPLDLAEAARAISTGRAAPVDVGEVNGRVFINNSSIGLYPEVVIDRDAQRKHAGRSKWVAMLIAAGRVLRRFPLLRVRVDTPRATITTRTPFVFIGNNEYSTNVLQLGSRTALDHGRLGLYTVRCHGRLHLFWVLVRAIFGRAKAVRELEDHHVTEASVTLHRRTLAVAMDGEVTRMTSPLHYKIRPGVLSVLRPLAVETAVSETEHSEAQDQPDSPIGLPLVAREALV